MPFQRQSWVSGNQFSGVLNFEIDFEVNTGHIPPGSRLVRTWIDTRFNRFGQGIEPPEYLNQCGPLIWGVCYYDDVANNPGVNADDDAIDWLWREMIAFGPAIQEPSVLTSDPQWEQIAIGPNGLRDSKGQRHVTQAPAFIHFALNLPSSFGNDPPGLRYEIFVHTLWKTV